MMHYTWRQLSFVSLWIPVNLFIKSFISFVNCPYLSCDGVCNYYLLKANERTSFIQREKKKKIYHFSDWDKKEHSQRNAGLSFSNIVFLIYVWLKKKRISKKIFKPYNTHGLWITFQHFENSSKSAVAFLLSLALHG